LSNKQEHGQTAAQSTHIINSSAFTKTGGNETNLLKQVNNSILCKSV